MLFSGNNKNVASEEDSETRGPGNKLQGGTDKQKKAHKLSKSM